MKIRKYYKFLVFMTIMNLSLCLFTQSLHASELNANDECGEALISIPAVLEPVGASLNTEMIETSVINIPNVMRGTFVFPLNQQKRKIEIEYKLDGNVDEWFLSKTGFKFLKEILDKMPAKLLSKVNRMTVLITAAEEFQFYRRESQLIVDVLKGASEETLKEKRGRILTEYLQLEEAHYNPESDEITLVIPYIEDGDNLGIGIDTPVRVLDLYVDGLSTYLIHRMQHKLGHIMAYHRYGQITPDQEWHDAILMDNEGVFNDGDTNMAEDFAEAMALYLKSNAGLNHPETRKYTHRFKILDEEVVGVTPSERQRITERNHVLEEQGQGQIDEISGLLELLGIVNSEGRVYEDKEYYYIGIKEESLEGIRENLLENPSDIKMVRKLAEKAFTLHRNKPLDFTSLNTSSSVRENLIRRLVWPGLLFIPEDEANIPQFITGTIDLLDTLSTSEITHRLYIFNETLKMMEQMEDPDTLLEETEETYILFERALREVQSREQNK